MTPDDVNRKAHELTVEVSRAEIALEDESINYRDPRDVFWFDHIVKDGEAARNFDKIRHCIENMRTALLNLIQINQYMQNGELAAKTEDLLRQHEVRRLILRVQLTQCRNVLAWATRTYTHGRYYTF